MRKIYFIFGEEKNNTRWTYFIDIYTNKKEFNEDYNMYENDDDGFRNLRKGITIDIALDSIMEII